MSDINILQLNIKGILSIDNQLNKRRKLYHTMLSKKIDVVLLQEWSATLRQKTPPKTDPTQENNNILFPTKYFPDYNVHFHSTETAILYHKDLCVTPLPEQSDYNTPNHRENFHLCGIVLYSGRIDYGIYSVYRPKKATATQIFKYNFETIIQ